MAIRYFCKLLITITLAASALGGLFLAGRTVLDNKQAEWIFDPSDRNWGQTGSIVGRLDEFRIRYKSTITGQVVNLHTLISPSSRADAPVMLYLHGARWNITGSVNRIQRMQELGFTVVAIEYCGFGKTSSEVPSEKMAYEDTHAA
jgi:uncharacterized protein